MEFHLKNQELHEFAHWIPCKYGYVDSRFNEEEWNKNYNFRNK